MADGSVVEGGSFPFHLECKNSRGTVVVPTDATVALSDPSLGTVTINADGSGGVFTSTAGPGSEVITGTAGGVSAGPSNPFSLDITADTTIVSVAVVSDAVSTVAVVPGP